MAVQHQGHVVALSGGIGGAKLALGLSKALAKGQLSIIANTGDDFRHYGLHVSPDIDTLIYTLAECSNTETGWGRAEETWSFMAALRELGEDAWFQLGDKDLATHVLRTARLAAGVSLSEVTAELARRFQVEARILPMSDSAVRTVVDTDAGRLPFQHYFVKQRCQPRVRRIDFDIAPQARPAPGVMEALSRPDLSAVLICPSNPFLSVDPILAVPGMRAALREAEAPLIVVTPIVGGRAVKGPTAKIMGELGLGTGADEVAGHYRSLADGFVLDAVDGHLSAQVQDAIPRAFVTNTLMTSLDDKIALANFTLQAAASMQGQPRHVGGGSG